MTDTQPTEVQLSIKFGSNGSGYAIVKAGSVEDLVQEAGKLMDQANFLNAVVEEVQARGTFAQAGMTTEQIPPDPWAQQQQQPGTPAGPPGKNCAHGVPMLYRTGVSKKTGNPYKGWFCTVTNDPRMGQCPSQFLN